MAYCTVEDVEVYLPYVTLNTTSKPTKEDVSHMCDDASNMIDAIIRSYATLPITDVAGKAYLKNGASYYVLAHVYRSLERDPQADKYDEKFDAFLEEIRNNIYVLQKPNADHHGARSAERPDIMFTKEGDLW